MASGPLDLHDSLGRRRTQMGAPHFADADRNFVEIGAFQNLTYFDALMRFPKDISLRHVQRHFQLKKGKLCSGYKVIIP